VAQTFQENNLQSPWHNDNGYLAFIVQWYLRGYMHESRREWEASEGYHTTNTLLHDLTDG
jgi:hypothetical protein